jgi:SPP1 family predicted phage head-tail adaptor
MTTIAAGQLKHRVRIQQPRAARDPLGAPIQSWIDVATVWADIQPLTGREAVIASRIASEIGHQITVRYQPVFDDPKQVASMRALYGDRVFAIHAALNDDEEDVAMVLLVSEGLRSG